MDNYKKLYFRLTYKELVNLMKMLEIGKYRYTFEQRKIYDNFDYVLKNLPNQ